MEKIITVILEYPEELSLDPILEQTILFLCTLGIRRVEIGPLDVPPMGNENN